MPGASVGRVIQREDYARSGDLFASGRRQDRPSPQRARARPGGTTSGAANAEGTQTARPRRTHRTPGRRSPARNAKTGLFERAPERVPLKHTARNTPHLGTPNPLSDNRALNYPLLGNRDPLYQRVDATVLRTRSEWGSKPWQSTTPAALIERRIFRYSVRSRVSTSCARSASLLSQPCWLTACCKAARSFCNRSSS